METLGNIICQFSSPRSWRADLKYPAYEFLQVIEFCGVKWVGVEDNLGDMVS